MEVFRKIFSPLFLWNFLLGNHSPYKRDNTGSFSNHDIAVKGRQGTCDHVPYGWEKRESFSNHGLYSREKKEFQEPQAIWAGKEGGFRKRGFIWASIMNDTLNRLSKSTSPWSRVSIRSHGGRIKNDISDGVLENMERGARRS